MTVILYKPDGTSKKVHFADQMVMYNDMLNLASGAKLAGFVEWEVKFGYV